MKRFLLLLLIVSSFGAKAQLYNNEWIDYNKTYYKFKIGVSGLYRINQAALASIGLGNINADYFQIWRHGKEVPLYTSVQGAPLGPSDFIEFWGEANDGKVDKELYRQPDYQLSDKWSLQTDTAAFFLTVNPAGGNLRFINTENNVAGNTLAPEPYFMYTAGYYFRNKWNPGRAELVGSSYTYSSSYDYGEGWTSGDIAGKANSIITLSNDLKPYTGAGAPSPVLKVNLAGNAVNARNFTVKLNGDSVLGGAMNYYDYAKVSATVTTSQISSGVATVEVANRCQISTDRMVLAQIELTYARQFYLSNHHNFTFELPANNAGNYLEIRGISVAGVPPILYDITNGRRYIAEYSNPFIVKYALLPSSVDRQLLLTNQAAANVKFITSFQQRNFINYKLAANQGDFLIITNAVLTGSSGGIDPVEDYRQYRSSLQGGGFNAKVYLYDQLEDQFGFGIKKHPLSIRNFLRWARAHYSQPLKNVFIIGRGVVYNQYKANESNPDIEKLDLVPTFGEPASDNLLSAEGSSSIPLTPIGRLAVINKTEIADYLDKVKQYEQVKKVSSPLVSDMLWKKNVVHITGASDDVTTDILAAALNGHKKIIEDTFYGAKVHTFSKTSSSSVEQLASSQLASLMNNGIGLLTYFGHSSSTTLEFNLDNPQNYSNAGKYPVFIVMGCNAGNFYNFSVARFTTKETISERYVLAKERGSVAFMASTHLGIVHYLDIYNTRSYQSASFRKYGASLGEIMDDAIVRTFALLSENDFYARFQCEQFTLHGDPAIRMYSFDKPDYVIEEPMVKVSPSFISVNDRFFKVTASFANLGKAPDKNIVVSLKHVYPDNSEEIIRDTVPGTRYMDSIVYNIDIKGTIRDKGQHKLMITIDAENEVDEEYETNNTVTKDVYIFEDDIRPVYPYEFSILKTQNPTLIASTANAFAETRTYTMEIDTTEMFNSPLKVSRTTSSAGGIVEFIPGISFSDSTVYYWRVSPSVPNTDPKWNTSSFIYINGTEDGFAQSHFYQHTKSQNQRLTYDSASRLWSFGQKLNNIFVRNGVYPQTSSQGSFYTGTINDQIGFIGPGTNYDELIFTVIDSVTFKAWKNCTGLFGSVVACGGGRDYNFQYLLSDPTWRKKAMDFLDSIPSGDFVVVRTNTNPNTAGNTYPDIWKSDETIYGSGNSLYHKLYDQGFLEIDSFNRPRSWIFVFQKDRKDQFAPQWQFSDGIYDGITLNRDCPSPDTLGYITSPLFGPAKAWHVLKWRGNTIDTTPGDRISVDVIGVNNNGAETTVFSEINFQDFDISSINPALYPYVKLRLNNQDSLHFTPYQLKYWMVTYDPVPEGAVAPNIYFVTKDTVEAGEPMSIGLAFKNISQIPFDSLKAKLVITNDKTNVDQTTEFRLKNLAPGDTVKIDFPVDTKLLSGRNTMFLNFNPDFDQPEHYLFNNYVFRSLYVRPDSLHPLLDVTFDGTHILNKDIVSPKPNILVKLTDEAKWMVLDDTSLLTVSVRFPDGSLKRYYFENNSDTIQFIPAGQAPNPNNVATINFKPYFPQDGEYELIVTGKDRSENTAGNIQYRVAFQVYNKPMISNMLNYPNPFTTSTAFVFTITGSEIPQNIRIQILTITGKVVREITKDELGPLHIGRNITEFKWDGTDQYGQKLANGIYLYRVITNLNGKALDKFKSSDDKTDKFFNNGYGKMYLMR
jgi:hypothetical protein